MNYEMCCKPYKRPQNDNVSKSNSINLEEHTIVGSSGNKYKIIIKWVFRRHDDQWCWLFQCGCSCPSWIYQNTRTELRTCKHLKVARGDFSENMRCIMNQEFFGGEDYAPKPKVSHITAFLEETTQTNSNNIDVTLAEKFTTQDPTGFYMSEKLDGMRCVWNGKTLCSRKGNILNTIPKELVKELPHDIALDGELYLGRGKFQDLMSIVKRNNSRLECWKDICYVVFDAPLVKGSIEKRIEEASKGTKTCSWVHTIKHTVCCGKEHAISEMNRVVKEGGEGVMLKHPSNDYKNGRTPDLLKVKPFHDDEAVIIQHNPGTGRNTGRLGSFTCKDEQGRIFKVGIGIQDSVRELPPEIGTQITYRFQERTKAGNPRFPRFVRIHQV